MSFLKEVKSELNKVVWISKRETLQSSIFVIIALLIASVFFYFSDALFLYVIKLFMGY